ncbi:hypothetical protein AB1Y20_005474 [Prymnesium parvum]|uniref:Pre-mRNA-splicing factor SLU7 n=1 Tax=Prymnesium parvum TaxID=97485 RepID=A0AB34J6M7_PRYPA
MAAAAFKSRDDHRRERELEEARKAGTIPAELDEDGNEINPHIPQYMAQAPWYLNQDKPGLKHTKNWKGKETVASASDFIPRGIKAGPAATKFRKGACANCGAMTHKVQDCVERPRKKGAKFTGKNIAPDEVKVEMAFDYAGKRDHWAQYDPSDHTKMVENYDLEVEKRLKQQKEKEVARLAAKQAKKSEKEMRREQRRRARADAAGQGGGAEHEDGSATDTDTDTDGSSDGSGDEAKANESEQLNLGQAVGNARAGAGSGAAKMSVRNLRIREDRAKYLINLDVNSAYYDPKTRSMRANPTAGGDVNDGGFHGDNFNRVSGDARQLAAMQLYQFEAYDKGQNLHLNADPTTLELMNKIYREKKESLKSSKANKILEKYGGAEHMQAPAKELLFAQTEEYVEYDKTGSVLRGQEKAVVRSKYVEDVHTHNHTAIWGSYFDRHTFRWGYADDHSTIFNSYGTGEAGKRARDAAAAATLREAPERQALAPPPAVSSMAPPSRAMYGMAEELGDNLDEAKVQAAIRAEKERKASAVVDERKRKFNSMKSDEVTAEEMEAYHRSKARADDPMAAM